MVVWNNSGPASRDAPFCFIDHEKDIVISVTPYVDINDTGKPIPTPQEQLLKFLKIIRNCSEDVLKNYACAQFGGHEWTDDPALVGEVNGDEEAA